jgi:hypothetical protein
VTADLVQAWASSQNIETLAYCGFVEFVDKKKNEKRVAAVGQTRIWLLRPPVKGKKIEVW